MGSPEWITSNQVLKDTYGMTSQDITDAKARIDAVAGYLTGLSMTAEEAGSTEIISVDKFIDQMSLTVKEQIERFALLPFFKGVPLCHLGRLFPVSKHTPF